MSPAAPPIALLTQVSKVFDRGGGDRPVVAGLTDVSLRIDAGEYVAIVGPSGAGKSTLLNLLGCLDVPTSGRYELLGADVGTLPPAQLADVRNALIGFVFQSFHLLAHLTVAENVELPLLYAGLARAEREARVRARLEAVGLSARATHRPSELSGGEQQRAAIARALVTEPPLLLADEPTGSLDQATGAEILEIFESLHRSGQTLVLVTHDPGMAKRARRLIEVRDGRVFDRGAPGSA